MKVKLFLVICLLAAHLKADGDLTYPIYYDLDMATHSVVFGETHRMASHLEKERLAAAAERGNIALGFMVKRSVKELRKKGYKAEAEKIEKEWAGKYDGFLLKMRVGDIGDFAPLSDWLSALYITLELTLGRDLMVILHLDDIFIFNHTIPVVFQPCKGPWVKTDYMEHFAAFTGVCAYWATFTACFVGTSGIASFLCVPAGVLAEALMNHLLGPPVGRGIYQLFCE